MYGSGILQVVNLTTPWLAGSTVLIWALEIMLSSECLAHDTVVFLLHLITVSADETTLGLVVELTETKLLDLIESAYPNPVTVEELATQHGWDTDAVSKTLTALQEKGLVQVLDHGAFTRAGQADSHIQVCFLLFDGTVEIGGSFNQWLS
jgi:hypothetical protein